MRKQIYELVFISVLLWIPPLKADLVFSAPPRESKTKALEIYQPITDFLSQTIGEKVEYRYTENWLVYQSAMQKGEFDIVFDGPHFIGWRIDKLKHTPVAKLPGQLSFIAFVSKNETGIQNLTQLVGRSICVHAPPNLATLTVLSQFDNPTRQPLLIEIQGFPAAYKGVIEGKCQAGILPTSLYSAYDKEGIMRVIFRSAALPNQAFSVGPRISREMQTRVAQGLLSPAGLAATAGLREEYKAKALVPATVEEYRGLGRFLKDVWGF